MSAPREKQMLITAFFLCALCSLVPYAAQMRGYHYHLISYITYIFAGLSLIFSSQTGRFIRNGYALPMQAAIMAVLTYMMVPYDFAYPNHKLYTENKFPLAATLAKESPDHSCPFFLFNDSMEFIHQTSLYSGRVHASRFPCFWFLPAILKAQDDAKNGKPSTLTPAAAGEKQQAYADMVGADLEKWKPCVLLIDHYQPKKGEDFDFAGWFSVSPAFAAAWKNYRPAGTVRFNRKDFFPGAAMAFDYPMTFDIYVLNKDQSTRR
jgi:hypothetical protein